MRLSDLGEKKIINKLREFLDIGDDAACIKSGKEYLVLTSDMIYQETHILEQMSWEQIGRLVVTINLSDIAAMGAKPLAFLLNYGSPDMEYKNFESLIKGVKSQCDKYDTVFAGGDTNCVEKLTLSGAAVGSVKKPVYRSGAKPGDIIAVTGTLGGASLGTKLLLRGEVSRDSLHSPVFLKALQPEPRIAEGIVLNECVNSMTDISDGLSTSIMDIAENSNVGMEIGLEKIPIDENAFKLARLNKEDVMEHALHGEGDYELLFTLDEADYGILTDKMPSHVIGRVTKNKGLICIDSGGGKTKLARKGYEHFKM